MYTCIGCNNNIIYGIPDYMLYLHVYVTVCHCICVCESITYYITSGITSIL